MFIQTVLKPGQTFCFCHQHRQWTVLLLSPRVRLWLSNQILYKCKNRCNMTNLRLSAYWNVPLSQHHLIIRGGRILVLDVYFTCCPEAVLLCVSPVFYWKSLNVASSLLNSRTKNPLSQLSLKMRCISQHTVYSWVMLEDIADRLSFWSYKQNNSTSNPHCTASVSNSKGYPSQKYRIMLI